MLILFDFRCTNCDTVEERLVKSNVKEATCSVCTGRMKRVISPVRSRLEGITGHFPDAAEKWARQHEKAGREEPR